MGSFLFKSEDDKDEFFRGVEKRFVQKFEGISVQKFSVMAKKALSPIRKEEDGQRRHGCCNMVMAE